MRPKHILLLYKVSTYEHYCQASPDYRPSADEIRRFKETHETHYRTLDTIGRELKDRGLKFTKTERGMIADYDPYDFVITVGGDGTFLEAARYVNQHRILGVNSDPRWSVGRLCSATAENFVDMIDRILLDTLQPHAINRLKIATGRDEQEIHCVNDVLICHANPASLSRYILKVGPVCEEQRGSGLWVATAAGSTGAVRSAGGVVQDVDGQKMQYRPRELYQGWHGASYQLRGGLLEPDVEIQVTSLMAEGMIFVDGSHQRIPFRVEDQVRIIESKRPLYMF